MLVATLFRHLRDANKVETFLEYCETSNGLLFLQGTTLLPEVSGDVEFPDDEQQTTAQQVVAERWNAEMSG